MTNLHLSYWRRALGLSLLALAPLVVSGVQAQTAAPAPEAPTGRVAKQAGTAARDMAAAANLRIPTKSASCSDAMSAMHSDFKPAMIPI